jgi:DNA mismatch repair ATPase MutS
MLKGLEDVSRIVQKLTLGRGETDDLLNIRKAILGWNQLFRRLQFERQSDLKKKPDALEDWRCMDLLVSQIVDLNPLVERIEHAIDDTEFDKKEKLAAGLPVEPEDTDEPEVGLPFGRPTYGGHWRVKSQ